MQIPSKRRRPSTILFAGLAAFSLLAAACGDDDGGGDETANGTGNGDGGGLLAEAQESGITLGIAGEVPYGFEEGGEATGEAPEVAKVLLEEMGITQIDFSVAEFASPIPGLNAGRFDMVAAGMFITEERADQALFVGPDYCATTSFGVAEGNPEGVSDFESIIDTGATLGVLEGAVELGYAEDIGVPEDQISTFPAAADLYDGLAAGRVDAVALTTPSVETNVADLEGYEATEGFVPVVNGEEQFGCGAFVLQDEDTAFAEEFNAALDELQAEDGVLPIIEEFPGFNQQSVDLAKETSPAALGGENGAGAGE